MDSNYDVIIVGGGIAGMTAAIYTARANLNVLILEKEICGGLANWTNLVENFPSYIEIHGMDLMEKVKAQVENLGVRVEEITKVSSLDLKEKDMAVITPEADFHAKSVILATGRAPIRLPIETDCDERIHYCSICDGATYKGKDVVVVGGGNSGFDESCYLIDLGVNGITIVEAMDCCIADQTTQKKAYATGKITTKTGNCICAIRTEGDKILIALENAGSGTTEEIKSDGVFVFIGQRPNTEFLKGKIALNRDGYIITDSAMRTSNKGIFAAGDVIEKQYRQLTTAASDGTIAALDAVKYVRALEGNGL